MSLPDSARQRPPSPPAIRALGYWLHRYRRIWPGTVVISIVNPLLFLTAIGAGLGKIMGAGAAERLHNVPYLDFVVPGLLAAAVMQTTFIEAAGPVMQSVRARGNYRAAAATPLTPADILHGHLFFITMRMAMTAVVFTAVSAFLGAVGPVRALPMAAAALLTGVAFATPVAAWAVTVVRPSSINAALRFVIMPLFMFSGTFFPISQLPRWVQDFAVLTPLWHGTQLCRTFALGTATVPGTLAHIGYLTAMAVAGLWLARHTYQRTLHG